jgi:hypothetical protein
MKKHMFYRHNQDNKRWYCSVKLSRSMQKIVQRAREEGESSICFTSEAEGVMTVHGVDIPFSLHENGLVKKELFIEKYINTQNDLIQSDEGGKLDGKSYTQIGIIQRRMVVESEEKRAIETLTSRQLEEFEAEHLVERVAEVVEPMGRQPKHAAPRTSTAPVLERNSGHAPLRNEESKKTQRYRGMIDSLVGPWVVMEAVSVATSPAALLSFLGPSLVAQLDAVFTVGCFAPTTADDASVGHKEGSYNFDDKCVDVYLVFDSADGAANALLLSGASFPPTSDDDPSASAGCFPFAPLVWRKDHWCIDGGLSDFQPVIDENTITVSPFYFSSADIRPSRYVPLWWSFFPPKDEDTIEWLYHLGQEDAISFFAAVDDTVEQLATVTPSAGGDRRDEGELSDDTPFFPLSPNPSGGGSMLSPPSEDGSSYNSSDTAATSSSSSTLSAPLTPGRRIIREEQLKRRAEIQRKRAARLAEDSGHAYDIRRRVSVHRFLGYNTVGNVGVKWLVYAADLLLLIFLVAFWKPLALLAVYTELICRIAGHLFYAVAREMLQLLPMISLAMAFCDPHLTLAYGLILLLLIQKLYVVGPVVALPASQGDLWQTARCLMSLSLMRRFVSGGLSREDLRQHDLLMEHSVVYRVIRHII